MNTCMSRRFLNFGHKFSSKPDWLRTLPSQICAQNVGINALLVYKIKYWLKLVWYWLTIHKNYLSQSQTPTLQAQSRPPSRFTVHNTRSTLCPQCMSASSFMQTRQMSPNVHTSDTLVLWHVMSQYTIHNENCSLPAFMLHY